jgi:RPA family protein
VSVVENRREVARRLFAAEFDDASFSYSEGDEERAPNYVVTPTGARVNRLFAVGVLTEVENVNEEVLRGRVVDPTGAFVTYAGQYQPDAMAFLDRATPPAFVSLTGKARTYQPDDSDRVFTSVRPESVNDVDADTRDRWVVSAAEATLERVATFAAALEMDERGDALRDALEARGVDPALATGVPMAIDHYGTTEHYLEAVRRLAVEALELVAGDRDSVDELSAAPGDAGPDSLGPLPDLDLGEYVPAEPAVPETDGEVGTEAASTGEPNSIEEPNPTEQTTPVEETDDDEAVESTLTESDAETSVESASAEEATTADESAADVGAADGGDAESAGVVPDETIEVESDPDPASSLSDSSDALGDFGDDAGESAADSQSPTDDLGDFGSDGDAPEAPGNGESTTTADSSADASGEMYEMDEEERREVEAEFGTEFSTGAEVDAPGEADIDVPGADEAATADAEDDLDDAPEADDGADEPADAEAEADPDVDLDDAAVEAMSELDDGDGADREAVVAAVVDRHGADPDDVEDAIEDALMGGKCYEPAEGSLKAI